MVPPSATPPPTDPAPEFPFAAPEYLFHLMTMIVRHRDARIEDAVRHLDITLSKGKALMVIYRLQPCTMSELADYGASERTTMTRTVDQLVAHGWVEREEQPADRRQVLLRVTEAGSAMVREILTISRKINRENLEGIPEEAQHQLIRLSQAVAGNVAPNPQSRDRILTFSRPEKSGS